MAFGDTGGKVFGLRQVRLASREEPPQIVTLPAAQTMTCKERVKSSEFSGDDRTLAIVTFSDALEWELEAGGISLQAIALMTGRAVTTEAAMPNRKATFTAEGDESFPYFKIYGKSIGDVGDDVHVKLFKTKLTGALEGQFVDGEFFVSKCSGVAIRNGAVIYQIVQNETQQELAIWEEEPQPPGNTLLRGLIAFWPMNEAAGANNALDLYANARHLTQIDSPGSAAGKVYATARTITSGAQAFQRANEAALILSDNDSSFAMWVYVTTGGRVNTYLSKATVGAGGEITFYSNPDMTLHIVCDTTTGQSVMDYVTTVPLNAWTLLVVQHDLAAKTFTIYKDGGFGETKSYTGDSIVTTNAFTIGSWSDLPPDYTMRGRIGPFALWKGRKLGNQARAALWNEGAGMAYANFESTGYDDGSASNPVVVTFGDSITQGYSSTTPETRWANIVATTKGWQLYNAGISGTTLQNTVQNSDAVFGGPIFQNGRDTYASRVLTYDPDYVIVLYGFNDLRLNDVAFSTANFQNDLDEVVKGLIAGGVAAGKIVVCSPPYMTPAYYSGYAPYNGGSTLKHQQYTAACAAVAAANSTLYVDIYQAMIDGGGDSLVSPDHVHPNNAGHAVIAAAMLAAL